jgi:cytoskeleton protein RodZ
MTAENEKTLSQSATNTEITPGKLLIDARERAGLTPDQAAHDLYMSVTKLRALEENNFEYTGPDTFTRGYLRAYANLLKLNPAEVIAAYDRYLNKQGIINKPVVNETHTTNKRLWRFVILIFVGLLFLWLLTLWFFDKPKRTKDTSKAPVLVPLDNEPNVVINKPQEIPTTETLAAVANSAASQASVAGQQQTSSVSVVVIDSSPIKTNTDLNTATQQVTDPTTVEQVEQTKTPVKIKKEVVDESSLDEITLSFIEECWLSVTDANQDLLASDLMTPGSSVTLRGVAPFEVKVGNSSAVSIILNGDFVEVVPARNSKVLTLTVGNPHDGDNGVERE